MTEKKDTFLLSRITDACCKNFEPRFFDFFDEVFQQKIADTIKHNGVPYLFFGGHPDAERKMLCIYPDYLSSEDLEWPIFAIEFEKVIPIDHRNVLGELMHLGITRESIGDIDVGEKKTQIILHQRLQEFMWINFNQIKGREIRTKIKTGEQIESFEKNYKRMSVVVASNRMDGIINKIWGFSRQNSLVLIKQGKLRVNYVEIYKNDFRLKSGDVLSLRGKGKAKIISMDERTKKGNIRLEVDRYI
ncbi:YlmH/Sll1252 family protein [Acetobacterium wieringae]|uniref:YlmH/Sll1252 family protein n=1 Tax=Acetobacterium wieringae TaxID=52694 RepID=UPI0020348FB0|nr:YlmH/Sll1252 family protein [Acetobacterium wieringae]URN83025.1 YlmH/Sll1252 family protein [Acetobacterium wieringae]